MKIQAWPSSERPREKLLTQGSTALSDAELLAVLMGSGRPGLNCVEWARQQLAHAGGIQAFFNLSSDKLQSFSGMGPARTAQILAVREMAIRFARIRVEPRKIVHDPSELADYLKLSLGRETREKFRVFFFNKKMEILEEKDLFTGTIDETPVYPREIVRCALDCHATAVILVHNHPSGRLQPSAADIQVTEKIISACALVDIRVLDHLIIGAEGYFSFSSEGLLDSSRKRD